MGALHRDERGVKWGLSLGDFLQKGWCKCEEGFPSGTVLPCCQLLCGCRRCIIYKTKKNCYRILHTQMLSAVPVGPGQVAPGGPA